MSANNEDSNAVEIEVISKKDAAEMLGVTTKTIDRMVASKKIPHFNLPTGVGKKTRVRFIRGELLAWIRGSSVVPMTGHMAEGA